MLSREDRKKAKELEELRKTGAAPPELDEEGKMINPHIPNYVSNTPWYYSNTTTPTLKHQTGKVFEKAQFDGIHNVAQKNISSEARGQKWRKGSCENCGSMTHKTKDCLERPRAKTAKQLNTTLGTDDTLTEVKLGFDGKRDRWNNYNPSEYAKVMERYDRIEQEKKKARAAELLDKLKRKQAKDAAKKENGGDDDDDDDESDSDVDSDIEDDDDVMGGKRRKSAGGDADEDDDDDDADAVDTQGKVHQKFDQRSRTTVRNLRIREDTAKYLLNLDVNSAYYDPKTRSMRENPLEGREDRSSSLFRGDNVIRQSGLVGDIAQLQRFIHTANDYGDDSLNAIANPSEAATKFKEFADKKASVKEQHTSSILAKYGDTGATDGTSALSSLSSSPADGAIATADGAAAGAAVGSGIKQVKLPLQLLLAQSENYAEYTEDGRVLKGQEDVAPRTKYNEDVLVRNHTEIWGSYYSEGRWGYGCCKSMNRAAYCTGAAGRMAAQRSAEYSSSTATRSNSSSSGGSGGSGVKAASDALSVQTSSARDKTSVDSDGFSIPSGKRKDMADKRSDGSSGGGGGAGGHVADDVASTATPIGGDHGGHGGGDVRVKREGEDSSARTSRGGRRGDSDDDNEDDDAIKSEKRHKRD